ncbi:hypothetical protein HRR83_007082 [Exophiala dermatitidis]|nr:hypothetical protein HRR75_006201 [Exophiala dermatitidis]KAJ4511042.1 hypothetical protein HRR73_006373 [Exophiala dermatitidis]KAJ4545855.1 hypothetical protein HRR78_006131 [Exophiala dermatitidis]KAJ4550765.1 hypothetical protein HRR77_003122 [Exophiala dermatitidis]KAJ4591783.1 hypothetical protein HRR83_007082 [Exophiala dermatitidis]
MFVSGRDQGRRRRSQTYGVSKASRSSKLSLLSAITTGSHGSNDSASTITPESYSRSTGGGRRRRASKQNRSREAKVVQGKGSLVPKEQKERTSSADLVDVFSFLVHDENDDTATSEHPQEEACVRQEALSRHEESDNDNDSVVRSQLSDSGISMGDSSICQPGLDRSIEKELPPLFEEPQDRNDPQKQSKSKPTAYSEESRWKWPDIPPATHKAQVFDSVARTSSPQEGHVRFDCPAEEPQRIPRSAKRLLSGYDLISEKLSRGEFPLLFRRFDKVHFRMLLQLQDEIVEMEEELSLLDSNDTESRINSDGSISPASRRINWQWHQTDLHGRRLEVLGRLYLKLEQYYQALILGQKVQRSTSQAAPSDVQRLRSWLRDNNPLSAAESRFLDDEDDLILLTKATNTTASQARESVSGSIPFTVLTTALFPLLCFKFVVGISNRLILLTALLAMGLSRLEKLDQAQAAQHQHQQWLVACFGVALLAALFF